MKHLKNAMRDYAKFRLQTSRFTWKFYRWYSTEGKFRIASAFPLKVRTKVQVPNRSMTVIVTNICNADCIFCAKRKVKLKPKVMTMELFKKAVDQFHELGGNSLQLTPTIGDVLVDSGLAEKISYARSKGMVVAFFTNGILLANNGNYKKIVDAGTSSIGISVGDVDEKYDSKIYGITEETSRLRWDGIFKLIQYAEGRKADVRIFITFRPARPPNEIVKTDAFKALDKFRSVEKDFMLSYDNWGGKISQDDLSGLMKLKKGFKKGGPCTQLYVVSILPDGKARLCGCKLKESEDDDLVVGDLAVSDLGDIIENSKTKEIRENFAKGIYPEVCKDCTLYREAK